MSHKVIHINGGNFSDLEGFYDEIDRLLTKDLNWKTGHNLDALNDLLRGGFGVHEYEEPVEIVWDSFSKSKLILGEEMTKKILEIIASHDHIKLKTD